MEKLEGIKLALCQMPVVIGRPDLNVKYIVREILNAKAEGADIIIFPELCVTGYIIGDMFEREEFIEDANKLCNSAIREATFGGITAIVGLPVYDNCLRGEDGRRRLYNSAVIYGDGSYLGHAVKTLQPNYRMFDDDRHFYSLRKSAQEESRDLEEFNNVFPVRLKDGREVKIGVMLCEDMWHEDYFTNPGEILVQNGAEMLVNISASPWGWQKSRKRHSVVRELLAECQVPLVYVNNAGLQNNGKNLIVFDGSSTVYDDEGKIIFEMELYEKGTRIFTFKENAPELSQRKQDDSRELYSAVHNAIREFCSQFERAIIGISGGIDSAVSAAALVDALGPDKVLGIYMPYSPYSTRESYGRARELAENLGIKLKVISIDQLVNSIAMACGVEDGTLGHENIQARARMEILAAITQKEHGIFVCNTNKVEAAFGYGTLYGDIAGALALLGDMIKREIYQLGNYLNEHAFKKQVIPAECFNAVPTAELNVSQKDPFDYGNLTRKGYHDEMVRAFTEFRLGLEWFLDMYLKGQLESELKLEAGTIKRLFPAADKFIADLEKHWLLYRRAFFKTNQMPPILIISKRAFGYDLRRSMLSAHFTQRYGQLKKYALESMPRRIAIYGGSFNPPGLHHLQAVGGTLERFDAIFIVPCGPRSDKDSVNQISFEHRKRMAEIAFGRIPRVKIDWRDLESGKFTPTLQLEEIYKNLFPNDEIWFVVGGDLVTKMENGKSAIQNFWKQGEKIWANLNWAIIPRIETGIPAGDLPPKAEVIDAKMIYGSSSSIRRMVAEGKNIENFVSDEIKNYIETNELYK